jgi:hypothetical protein
MSVLTVLLLVVTAALAVMAVAAARAAIRLRGKRLVTCPETNATAAVDMDLRFAAFGGAFGRPVLRLAACSRWPERGRCGMPCLDEVEHRGEACAVRGILASWYHDQRCACCRAPFGDIRWHDQKPALLAPDGRLVEWRELAAETVPSVLATHRPLCWTCFIAQTLRRQRPDLFEFRPPRPGARAV